MSQCLRLEIAWCLEAILSVSGALEYEAWARVLSFLHGDFTRSSDVARTLQLEPTDLLDHQV